MFFLQFKMKSFLFILSVHFVLSREMCREIKACRPVKQYLHLRKEKSNLVAVAAIYRFTK